MRDEHRADLDDIEEELAELITQVKPDLQAIGAVLIKMRAERCICAAVRLSDGRVFRGHRYGDCLRTAFEQVDHQTPGKWPDSMSPELGFVTSANRFVDREEGLRLQLAAGVESVIEHGYRGELLFAEDLY